MKKLIQLWDQFLFEKISPLPLGIFRAAFGALVFTNLLALFPTRETWWGPEAIVSRAASLRYFSGYRLNLLNLLPDTTAYLTFFYVVLMIAALFLMLGLFTRLSSILVWLGLVSLAHRCPMILNSGDTFLRVCSFWLMFTPAGKLFSLDRMRDPHALHKETIKVEAWQLRLLQIQFVIVYLTTFLSKIQGSQWLDGTAVGYVLRLDEFQRFPLPNFVFSSPMIHFATWSALTIEGALATLIWIPTLRLWVIASAILLHLGIDYSMNIPMFEWIMMWSLVLFVTEDDWKTLIKTFSTNAHRAREYIMKRFFLRMKSGH
jgi:hypothetical protein